MSYLTGDDAFEKVLDRLVDAHTRAQDEIAKRYETEAALRDASQKLDRAIGEAAVLKRDCANALPLLKELWEASDALVDLALDDGPASMNLKAVRARKALEAARDHCDQAIF